MGQSWLQTTLGVPKLFRNVQTVLMQQHMSIMYKVNINGETHSPAYFIDGMHDPQSAETTDLL